MIRVLDALHRPIFRTLPAPATWTILPLGGPESGDMDLWQLKIFCKVIELQSFSKAGEAVHLSQPTVSSHIKDLESHFGTPLIDRLARQALPTKAGELLYSYACRLLSLRDEADMAMAEFLGKIRGRLTIGGSTIPAGYVLPRLMGAFAEKHAGAQLALIVGDTSEILSGIADGRIEVGLVGARSEDSQLLQTPLMEDELRLVLPGNHPWADRSSITIPEMLREPFIVREEGSGTLRAFSRRLHETGHDIADLNIVAEMGSTEAVRQGIKSGVGISILSALAVAEDERTGALRGLTIKGLTLKRSFYLTRHRQRSPSPLCRAFIAFLGTQFGAAALD